MIVTIKDDTYTLDVYDLSGHTPYSQQQWLKRIRKLAKAYRIGGHKGVTLTVNEVAK